ncbi:MAG: adenylate kinase [Candidatus Krumholzibacteriia bacterium]
MNLVLAGPPGSGKGTQAALLAQGRALRHISTGELLRGTVASGTELGRRVEGILDRGELVPDDLVMTLIRNRLAADGGGWLLDGFPRTVAQAEGLVPLLADLSQPVDAVIVLQVPDDEIVRRIAGRLSCGGCGLVTSHDRLGAGGSCPRCGSHDLRVRADDREDTVRNRLTVYRAQTQPALEALGRWYPLRWVDGRGEAAAVAQRIAGVLEE